MHKLMVILACLGVGCSHASLNQALLAEKPDRSSLQPARVDIEASEVELETAPRSGRNSVELTTSIQVRQSIAAALDSVLGERGLGMNVRRARFRIKIRHTQ